MNEAKQSKCEASGGEARRRERGRQVRTFSRGRRERAERGKGGDERLGKQRKNVCEVRRGNRGSRR